MLHTSLYSHLICCFGIALVLAVEPARAEQQTPEQIAELGPSGSLEEVIVTARKRAENVNKVPESISVVNGDALVQDHVEDYQDIARTVPGVSFNVGSSVLGGTVGPGTTNVVIRGVSSQSGSATVALYMDDVSLTESNIYDGAAQPKFLDFSRVEIERGPQGTLFGASAMGGMIRMISNQPKMDVFETTVELDGSGTAHGGGNYDNSLILNIPVVEDKLALRVAAQVGYDSGYINLYQQVSTPAMPVNNFTQAGPLEKAGINYEDWQVGRITAKYQATDDLSLTAAVLLQNDHSGDTPVFYSASGLFATEKSVPEPIADKLFVPSLTVKDSFADFDLTSVTSYLYRQFKFQTDGTVFNDVPFATAFVDGNLAGVPGFVPNMAADDTILAGTPSYVHRKNDTYQWSQEFRAESKNATLFGQELDWVAGTYIQFQRADRDDSQFSPGISQEFQNIYGFSINSPQSPVAPMYFPSYDNVSWGNDEIYWDRDYLNQTQLAGFGQLDYYILPNLKATFGLRYLFNHLNYEREGGGIYEAGTLTNPLYLSEKTYATTPKFSLSYEATPTDTIYTTIAKGFRLGGPTGPASTAPCLALLASYGDYSNTGPIKYGADKLWSYEVGTKDRTSDGNFSIDIDGFYLDWTNIQQSIPLAGACGENIVQNAGNARSYGGEAEFTARLRKGLIFSLKGGVTQAYFTQITPLLAGVIAVGQAVPDVAKYTITPAIDYGVNLTGDYTGTIHIDYTQVGSSHGTTIISDPAYFQPGYGIMNANLGVSYGTWQVSLYAKNLLNNSQIIARPTVNYNEEGYTLRPLTVGMQIRAKF